MHEKKLSILIPTVHRHRFHKKRIKKILEEQAAPYGDSIEILFDDAENDSVGEKRNRLLERAQGKYSAFFDVDDLPSENYISLVMEGIKSDCDALSLRGMYYEDFIPGGIFEHSLKYNAWKTTNNEIKYERFQNHLNAIKTSITKQFKFPDKNYGEDFDWSTIVHQSGLIKTEHYIPEIIYHYYHVNNKGVYSQGAEEYFILEELGDKLPAKYLDIGAFHAFTFSNTRRLYELGWVGCLIEPQKVNYEAIASHYKHDPRMTVLNAALGETTDMVTFYDSGSDAVGSTSAEHRDRWAAGGIKYTETKVYQIGIESFLKLHCTPDVKMISLDTESTSIPLFRLFPDWVWEQIDLLVIEHDGHFLEVEEKLNPFGFFKVYLSGENIIMSKC